MMKLKAIIVEDEVLAQKRLQKLLDKHKEVVEVIGTANDGEAGLRSIEKHKPDLIFLDIEMPVMGGLEMLSHLDKQPIIIFTTAYNEYALRSFEENSIDYLLKPIKEERLQRTMDKLRDLLDTGQNQTYDLDRLQKMIDQAQSTEEIKMIKVAKGDKINLIKLENVLYFIAEDKLTKIVDNRSQHHLINPSLKQIESQLPKSFVRISRSCIINEECIKAVSKSFNRKLVFEMTDGARLSSGSSYLNGLKERWSF